MKHIKRDWQSSDIFTLEDWNRIVSNAFDLYRALGSEFTWLNCAIEDSASLPYYDIINNLESNLLNLSIDANVAFVRTYWVPITSAAYTHNPSYADFNRWEQLIHDSISDYSRTFGLYSGTFTSGYNRTRQSLGRSMYL